MPPLSAKKFAYGQTSINGADRDESKGKISSSSSICIRSRCIQRSKCHGQDNSPYNSKFNSWLVILRIVDLQ